MISGSPVSVVITTHRRPAYLVEALRSVAGQTYTRFDAIVVNDCPEDAERVDQLVRDQGDRRFRTVHHATNRGLPAARNTGIAASKGEIIAFLDDDDIWLPEKLRSHIDVHASDPKADIVYSGYVMRWEKGGWREIRKRASGPPHDVLQAMKTNRFCPATMGLVTIKRTCIAIVGGLDESLSQFQDWDLYYRLATTCGFRCIPEPLIVFRQHYGTRLTATFDDRGTALDRLIKKWNGEIDEGAFLEHYPALARLQYIQNLVFCGHRLRSIKSLQLLRDVGLSRKLRNHELPKTLLLIILGPFLSRWLISIARSSVMRGVLGHGR